MPPRLRPETVELVRVVPGVAFVRPLELELERVFVQTISSDLWQSGKNELAWVVSEVVSAELASAELASARSVAVAEQSPEQPPVCSSLRPAGQRRR